MINKLFSRTALHEHPDAAQRIQGIAQLEPGAGELASLVASDPAPEVRSAAAARCADLAALVAAWKSEGDASVRAALASSLAAALAEPADPALAAQVITASETTDAVRADVARRSADGDLRRNAIAAIGDEALLYELAVGAAQADTRIAAAERITSVPELTRLAEAAKQRDHGVARVARQRLDAFAAKRNVAEEADAILDQLEALAQRPGPILSAVVELNRRWQALDLAGDGARLARCEAARQQLQARFDREHDEQRARTRFERRWKEALAAIAPPADSAQLETLTADIASLRGEAEALRDSAALAAIAEVEQRIDGWKQELAAQANAEVLVVEAEQLAADTSIDNAKLPERWQALDRAIRTPALTRRFEAALMVIEQRRLAQVQAAQQEASAARARVHALLSTAEQALAAGQLQAARAAADEIKGHKTHAGLLPKPTVQRIGRLAHQLTELERWETFGQQNARVQLCERAEALATSPPDAPQLAKEVQKLRNEWKALDQQYAGVPKTLWERFDRACEKAYAPAARHFAEQAAQRKEVRKKREDFIAAAAAHAQTLLVEPRDWRGIERYLRDTDQAWREGGLGSVDPDLWKKLDARLKEALAPLREAQHGARAQARDARKQLIAEAVAVGAKAQERDAPAQIKAIQSRWQEQAKQMTLAPRDERTLWEEFRAACNAVFTARDAKRKEADERKSEGRRALEGLIEQAEALARTPPETEQDARRALRELQDQWRTQSGKPEPGMPALETRFRNARTSVESALGAKAKARESAVWQTLARKEQLCDELDRAAAQGDAALDVEAQKTASLAAWEHEPALPAAWERKLVTRRDQALVALADAAARSAYAAGIVASTPARRDRLLELEMVLGLASPPDMQPQRLALQVQQLRDRFQSAARAESQSPAERFVAWCAEPGVTDERDRQRSAQILAAVARKS